MDFLLIIGHTFLPHDFWSHLLQCEVYLAGCWTHSCSYGRSSVYSGTRFWGIRFRSSFEDFVKDQQCNISSSADLPSWDEISPECSTQLVGIMRFSVWLVATVTPSPGAFAAAAPDPVWRFFPRLGQFPLMHTMTTECAKGTSLYIARAHPACSSLLSSSQHSKLWIPATWSSSQLLNPESLLASPGSLPCAVAWEPIPGSKLEKSGGLLCFSPSLRGPCVYLMSNLLETICHICRPLLKLFFKQGSPCTSILHLQLCPFFIPVIAYLCPYSVRSVSPKICYFYWYFPKENFYFVDPLLSASFLFHQFMSLSLLLISLFYCSMLGLFCSFPP